MTCSAIEINLLKRRNSFRHENMRLGVKIDAYLMLYRRMLTGMDEVVTA